MGGGGGALALTPCRARYGVHTWSKQKMSALGMRARKPHPNRTKRTKRHARAIRQFVGIFNCLCRDDAMAETTTSVGYLSDHAVVVLTWPMIKCDPLSSPVSSHMVGNEEAGVLRREVRWMPSYIPWSEGPPELHQATDES